ncbi:hypothetical protein ES703_20537 [subsurface metagenome]
MSENYKNKRIGDLEETVKKLFDRIEGIPYYIAIKALSDCDVIPFNPDSDEKDRELFRSLKDAAHNAGVRANNNGVYRRRPNEVGNDMEPYVKDALKEFGLLAETPSTKAGYKKAGGYPDIYLKDEYGRATYLEVKTYNIENIGTSQRSFYFSPPSKKEDIKISEDARHLLISFQIETRDERRREQLNCYVPVKWRIYSIYDMEVSVKHEFNSTNKKMYRDEALLAEGDIPDQ